MKPTTVMEMALAYNGLVILYAGEYHLRLRQLEKSLLQALNDAKGKILDDDSVITSLETLKKEASDISKKVEETDKVIGEIETVSQQYLPLSQACSNIYFTLDSLSQVHFLYQYSGAVHRPRWLWMNDM